MVRLPIFMVTYFVCELLQENALSLELVLASERGKWYEESRKTWQDQWRSLLSTAHREWSRAQEAVTKAEVERARRQWEKKQGRVVQVRVRKGKGEAEEGKIVCVPPQDLVCVFAGSCGGGCV